jgi:hypothetical protein
LPAQPHPSRSSSTLWSSLLPAHARKRQSGQEPGGERLRRHVLFVAHVEGAHRAVAAMVDNHGPDASRVSPRCGCLWADARAVGKRGTWCDSAELVQCDGHLHVLPIVASNAQDDCSLMSRGVRQVTGRQIHRECTGGWAKVRYTCTHLLLHRSVLWRAVTVPVRLERAGLCVAALDCPVPRCRARVACGAEHRKPSVTLSQRQRQRQRTRPKKDAARQGGRRRGKTGDRHRNTNQNNREREKERESKEGRD